jgi:uncharacterized protein (TIGR02722 family)
MKKVLIMGLILVISLTIVSCGSTRAVSRVAADDQIDLSGRWNDSDAQLVAEAMVADVMKRAWLSDFTQANGKKPIVIIGDIRNRSSEHIDANLFTKDIERELINSGKVVFVASSKERDSLRDERLDQQTEASADSVKRLGQETGADFMLQGLISSVTDAVDGKKVVFYKVDLELINIETNEKAWIGSKQIKKLVEQSRVKM